MNNIITEAKRCPYYGCAGVRVCTYYSWTTHCPYPNCDKWGWKGYTAYDYNLIYKQNPRKIWTFEKIWKKVAKIFGKN